MKDSWNNRIITAILKGGFTQKDRDDSMHGDSCLISERAIKERGPEYNPLDLNEKAFKIFENFPLDVLENKPHRTRTMLKKLNRMETIWKEDSIQWT